MKNSKWILDDIKEQVCDVASKTLAIPRNQIAPASRLIEDLDCDSLDAVELMLELENWFDVTIPNAPQDPICKAIFVRSLFV